MIQESWFMIHYRDYNRRIRPMTIQGSMRGCERVRVTLTMQMLQAGWVQNHDLRFIPGIRRNGFRVKSQSASNFQRWSGASRRLSSDRLEVGWFLIHNSWVTRISGYWSRLEIVYVYVRGGVINDSWPLNHSGRKTIFGGFEDCRFGKHLPKI